MVKTCLMEFIYQRIWKTTQPSPSSAQKLNPACNNSKTILLKQDESVCWKRQRLGLFSFSSNEVRFMQHKKKWSLMESVKRKIGSFLEVSRRQTKTLPRKPVLRRFKGKSKANLLVNCIDVWQQWNRGAIGPNGLWSLVHRTIGPKKTQSSFIKKC